MSRHVTEIRNTPDQRVFIRRMEDDTFELTLGFGEPYGYGAHSEILRLTVAESKKLRKAVS